MSCGMLLLADLHLRLVRTLDLPAIGIQQVAELVVHLLRDRLGFLAAIGATGLLPSPHLGVGEVEELDAIVVLVDGDLAHVDGLLQLGRPTSLLLGDTTNHTLRKASEVSITTSLSTNIILKCHLGINPTIRISDEETCTLVFHESNLMMACKFEDAKHHSGTSGASIVVLLLGPLEDLREESIAVRDSQGAIRLPNDDIVDDVGLALATLARAIRRCL